MTINRGISGLTTALLIGMTVTTASAQAPAAAAAPKAEGMIRIGVAPSQAQMGQGNNAQGDYGSPIRNSIVLLMSGPAVEIVPFDAHLAIQTQAEAKQKQCDFILYSNVTVKPAGKSGFGKFMKMAAPVAGMAGMAGVAAGGLGGAMAGQMAGTAAMMAAQTAQEQAINQLAGFNGQIKSKDDVTVGYRLVALGETKPTLDNSLNAKAKLDGEDVLTPLLLKAAEAVLTEVTKQ